MKTSTFHRILALLGYVSCLAAAPAHAQMGPIQPVLVTDGKIEYPHDRPDIGDFSVPVDVSVAANGSVTKTVISSSSGNEQADKLAAAQHRIQLLNTRMGRSEFICHRRHLRASIDPFL